MQRGLERLKSELQPGLLTWRVDNNSALFAIKNEGSTRSWELSWLATRILEQAHTMGVYLNPIRVSSEENLLADSASRFKPVPDWSLKQSVVNKIFQLWGKADVDLMASSLEPHGSQ